MEVIEGEWVMDGMVEVVMAVGRWKGSWSGNGWSGWNGDDHGG
jgi:hypothetical protein